LIERVIPPFGGGATRPLQRKGGSKQIHRDPTVGPRSKVWIRGFHNFSSPLRSTARKQRNVLYLRLTNQTCLHVCLFHL